MPAVDYFSNPTTGVPVSGINPAAFIQILTAQPLADVLLQFYDMGALDCTSAQALVEATESPQSAAVVPAGTYTIPSINTWGITGTYVNTNTIPISLANPDDSEILAEWTIHMEPGNIVVVDSENIYNPNLLVDDSHVWYLTVSIGGGGSILNVPRFWPVFTQVDAPGFTGYAIPACGVAPVSTPPVIRSNILLANHSQFFNPFGIQGF